MSQFILTTDTSCDVPRGELRLKDVPYIPLTFTVGEETFADEFSADSEYENFYARIRAGAMPTTSQINAYLHEEFFDEILDGGAKAIVHLPLSGGLSNTYNSAVAGAQASMDKHPGAKIFVLDTLSATQGHRCLYEEALKFRDMDLPAKDAFARLEKIAAGLHHWIIVDDLMHLKRGGRVSGAAAYVGSLLKIKPLLVINDQGKLAVVAKPKGTAKAMNYVLDRIAEYATDIKNQTVYLAQADCPALANEMKALIEQRFGCEVVIGWIGPVIGAHTGAGTLGIVFQSDRRLKNQ